MIADTDIPVKNGIVIPGHELEIVASRSSGPGGQHVNTSSTRITLRWNVRTSQALSDVQKERVMTALGQKLTSEGEIIIHASSSRSQEQNKKMARDLLAQLVRRALHVPKKRMATRVPTGAKESRLQTKKRRSIRKKMRSGAHAQE